MVHDCDELLEDSPYSDSLLSCHRMLYNLRKQLMFTHWRAVLKCCRTFLFFKPMLRLTGELSSNAVELLMCMLQLCVFSVPMCFLCSNMHRSSGCSALFFHLGPLSLITHCLERELHYRCPVRIPVITDIIYRHTYILHIKL